MNKNITERQFEEIYNKHAGLVYNVALRIAADSYIAEETVQEVFLKVFKNFDHFENRSDIKTWIYKITVNTALNILKSRGSKERNNEAIDEILINHLSNKNENIEKNAELNDRDEKVRKMLESLDPHYRSIIVLREIEGLSYEEISKITGANINTVRTHIKRAREKLLKIFNKEGLHHELQ